MPAAFITGVAGPELTAEEAALVRDARPLGLILFSRNCVATDQIRRLVASFREARQGDDVLVLIDQEGGRVQRIRPPLGRALPSAAAFGAFHPGDLEAARKAAFLASRLNASDLRALGINANCAPVLDVPVAGAHAVIGNRAYGTTPEIVTTLGRAAAEGLMAGGVLAIMKHIPGHGRATADSHHELPVIDADLETLRRTDLAPFRALCDLPAAMTAHVVLTAIDDRAPASTSPTVIRDIVRGEIGFDGLLMSDDVSMQALAGDIGTRTAAVLAAGCDIALHCNGNLSEMAAVAVSAPSLTGRGAARVARCMTILQRSEPFDRCEAEKSVGRILSVVA